MPRKYDASSIFVPTDAESVRTNIGMYLGDVDERASLQCFAEIVHNAGDELREGGGGTMRVAIRPFADGRYEVVVADQGRGIPVETHPKTGLSTLETVLTKLHAGGKGNQKKAYGKRTIGVHGVGAAVVNACSERFEAWTHRGGRWWHIAFARGVRTSPVRSAGTSCIAGWPRGTVVRYVLDRDVLPEDLRLDDARRLCAMMRYWDELTIQYTDPERTGTLRPLLPMDLMRVTVARRNAQIIAGPVIIDANDVRAVVAWTSGSQNDVVASVAGMLVPSGTHVNGLLNAAHDALRAKDCASACGVLAVLDVSVDRPSFSGQNKTNLRTSETLRRVHDACTGPLRKWLKQNPVAAGEARAHVEKIGRINARADELRDIEKDTKQARKRTVLPPGFKSATGYPPQRREVYILEGKSAEGTAVNAKMPWQEVLPIRGKLPNLLKKTELLRNEIVDNIISVVGYDAAHLDRMRVGRVLILADADDDGDHIRVLLYAMLHTRMPELFTRGMIHVVVAPLFEAMTLRGEQVTGNVLKDMEKQHGRLKNVNRMKGWGGCEAPLLKQIAFDPASRTIARVRAPTADDEERFLRLLGKDTTERKNLARSREGDAPLH